jgi:hypothetical protein
MLTLIIICAIALSLVRWTATRVWHVLAAMVAGFLISETSAAPTIHQLLSQISGGHL